MKRKQLETELLEFGVIKVRESVFLGDYSVADDLEFLQTNKINYLINCNSMENPFTLKLKNLRYKNLTWRKNDFKKVSKIFTQILPTINPFLKEAEI